MSKISLRNRMPFCRAFGLMVIFFLTTGCATIVKGTTQEIPISSDPAGADILVDGRLVGTTPADVEIKRKRDHLVVIQKENYSPKTVPVVKNIGGAVWGNILAGGLIGWGVDATSGAQNNLTPKTIFVKLERAGDAVSTDSTTASSIGIQKLNELDQMRENKQISDEEYATGRKAVIEEYFPEMIPKAENGEASDTG